MVKKMKSKTKMFAVSGVLFLAIVLASSAGFANIFLDPGGPGGGGDPLEYYTGVVKDQFNRAVDNALVQLLEDGVVVDSDRTDSVGYYMINYQTSIFKTYKLRVSKTGYDTKTVFVFPVTTTKNISIMYRICTDIRGHVYYNDNGELFALEDAFVLLYDENCYELIGNDTTNMMGSYSFYLLNYYDVTYRIDVQCEGYTIRSEYIYIGDTSDTIIRDLVTEIDAPVFSGYYQGRMDFDPNIYTSYLDVGFTFHVYKSQKVEFSTSYCYFDPQENMRFWALSLSVKPSDAAYFFTYYVMPTEEQEADDKWICSGIASLYGAFDDHAWYDGCACLIIGGALEFTYGISRWYGKFELAVHCDDDALTGSSEVIFTNNLVSLIDIPFPPPDHPDTGGM